MVSLAFSENEIVKKEDCVKLERSRILEHLFEHPEFPGSARRVNSGSSGKCVKLNSGIECSCLVQ